MATSALPTLATAPNHHGGDAAFGEVNASHPPVGGLQSLSGLQRYGFKMRLEPHQIGARQSLEYAISLKHGSLNYGAIRQRGSHRHCPPARQSASTKGTAAMLDGRCLPSRGSIGADRLLTLTYARGIAGSARALGPRGGDDALLRCVRSI